LDKIAEDLRNKAEDLRNNPLLTTEWMRKQQELISRRKQLNKKISVFKQQMTKNQKKIIEEMYEEIKIIIKTISINNNIDLVLQKKLVPNILFMKYKTEDITKEVIKKYDNEKK
jgi:Skp family chaperone for outer membrane proteins